MASAAVEYDAQGKPIPAAAPSVEYDASGKPLSASAAPPQNAPQGNSGFMGPVQDAYDEAVTPISAEERAQHPVMSKVADFGRGVMEQAAPIFHPLQAAQQQQKKGLGRQFGEALAGPAGMAAEGLYDAGKGFVQDAKENGLGEAIPHQLGGLVAPLVAGGALDAADMIPRMGRAGATLESLDKQLADTPVTMSHSAAPMQRATELSVRTGASPTPFNAFLQRSQSLEPMSFPEARDYQSGMANPSVMDRLSTSGKMRGAVKQLNKNFFNDLRDAADTKGLGPQYEQGMSEYKNAARLKTAAKLAGAGAATAVVGPKLLKYLSMVE